MLFLYGMQRLQHYLPATSQGMPAVTPDTAWNTAASFVTNTNWQNYAGESTMGYLTQMSGLVVQQFMSAAVGLVVAIAMIRGFTRSRTDKLGNFWVDVTRAVIRLLIPLSIVGGLILIAGGAIENFTRLPHGHHAVRRAPDDRRRPGGLARRSSRTWGTTAAAGSTPTPRTRSRTPTRSRTGSRSSSCC